MPIPAIELSSLSIISTYAASLACSFVRHTCLPRHHFTSRYLLWRDRDSVKLLKPVRVFQGGPAPDPWREGSTNAARKINENKLLGRKNFMPSQSKCKTCKTTLHDPNATYCQGCAYQKGICHVCGRAESSYCQCFTSAFPQTLPAQAPLHPYSCAQSNLVCIRRYADP